jgi:hypothetical protein
MPEARLPHDWSEEGLMNKTRRYSNTILENDSEDLQFWFGSSLVLEMLLIAEFSRISISLLAYCPSDAGNFRDFLLSSNYKGFPSQRKLINDT